MNPVLGLVVMMCAGAHAAVIGKINPVNVPLNFASVPTLAPGLLGSQPLTLSLALPALGPVLMQAPGPALSPALGPAAAVPIQVVGPAQEQAPAALSATGLHAAASAERAMTKVQQALTATDESGTKAAQAELSSLFDHSGAPHSGVPQGPTSGGGSSASPVLGLVFEDRRLPPRLRGLKQGKKDIYGPNCFNAALVGAYADMPQRYVSEKEFRHFLGRDFAKVARLTAQDGAFDPGGLASGDILVFNDGAHAATWLGDGFVFDTAGFGPHQPYRILPLAKAHTDMGTPAPGADFEERAMYSQHPSFNVMEVYRRAAPAAASAPEAAATPRVKLARLFSARIKANSDGTDPSPLSLVEIHTAHALNRAPGSAAIEDAFELDSRLEWYSGAFERTHFGSPYATEEKVYSRLENVLAPDLAKASTRELAKLAWLAVRPGSSPKQVDAGVSKMLDLLGRRYAAMGRRERMLLMHPSGGSLDLLELAAQIEAEPVPDPAAPLIGQPTSTRKRK